MDRSIEFQEILSSVRAEQSATAEGVEVASSSSSSRRAPSIFLLKANEVFKQIDSFERLLSQCTEGFLGIHRFLPPTMRLGKLASFTEDDRSKMTEEVISFISMVARDIQDLHRQLDSTYHDNNAPAQTGFYQQVISSLLQKLNHFTKDWDKLQKDRKKSNITPSRLFAYVYSTNQSSTSKTSVFLDEKKSKDTPSSAPSSSSSNKPIPTLQVADLPQKIDASFAQRFVDEIAPPSKMKEYEQVATKQKDILLKESQSLQKKFSDDMQQSQRLESTVMSISSMIAEFTTMIESQSEVVEFVEEAAKDATSAVKATDEELLLTLERSTSYHWNMVALILALALLLLLLHFITP